MLIICMLLTLEEKKKIKTNNPGERILMCTHSRALDLLPGDGELEVHQEEVGIYGPLPMGGEE